MGLIKIISTLIGVTSNYKCSYLIYNFTKSHDPPSRDLRRALQPSWAQGHKTLVEVPGSSGFAAKYSFRTSGF